MMIIITIAYGNRRFVLPCKTVEPTIWALCGNQHCLSAICGMKQKPVVSIAAVPVLACRHCSIW